jgi:lipoprotein-releasing system permease protein
VAALIIVLSVMNGFQKEVRDRMLSVVAHVELHAPADEALPDFAKYDELNRQARNLVAEALAQLQDG